MRLSGHGNEAAMLLVPLAVLLALGMIFNGGPAGLATAADAFLRDVIQTVATTVGGWF